MKKIEEVAKEFSEKSVWACPISFKAGVEFAQRWISVEEEIPRNVWLNVKHDLKNMYGVVNIAGSIDYNFVKSNFTHWRPIELK